MNLPCHFRWMLCMAAAIGVTVALFKYFIGFGHKSIEDIRLSTLLRNSLKLEQYESNTTVTVTVTTAATAPASPSNSTRGKNCSHSSTFCGDDETIPKHPTRRELNVAIVETNGVHEEVMAALIHSFGSQPDVNLHLYKEAPRFGIEQLVSDFNLPQPNDNLTWNPIPPFSNHSLTYHPDIVVLVTCYSDPQKLESILSTLLKTRRTYVFCLLHETERWDGPNADLDAIIKPWAQASLISFVCLSPAVAQTLSLKGFQSWNRTGPDKIDRSILTYAPIFPVNLPPIFSPQDAKQEMNTSIAIQGIFEYDRRDYDTVFANFAFFESKRLVAAQKARGPSIHKNESVTIGMIHAAPPLSPVQLNLIGHGPHPDLIPESIEDYVHYHENLSYQDFYALLSQQTALLPAFEGDIYRWMKASSSVPAAMVAGVPIIADARVLKAYSYLGAEGLYMQREGENEFDVLERVMSEPQAWRLEKRRRVREWGREIWRANVREVREWVLRAGVEIRLYD